MAAQSTDPGPSSGLWALPGDCRLELPTIRTGSCVSIYRTDRLFYVIELAILGLLKESELHGYELKKRLREILGPLSSVSFGSLYPALARLEGAGFVKVVEAAEIPPAVDPAGQPDLGAGRRRRELAAGVRSEHCRPFLVPRITWIVP